MTQLCAGEA